MADASTRRRLLAAVGAAATTALAGCTAPERARLNPFAEPPVSMTVIRADGDESGISCRLDPQAVAEIPALQEPMDSLNDAADGDRIDRGLSVATGRQISNMFTRQCGTDVGGIYRYDGAAYLVGLTYRDQTDHDDHHDHLANESGTGTDGETATETPTGQ